jgi:recombinational DNA repair protein (RecF pathway)
MAGETAKCEALCLAIHPWSRTSHVVLWLTERGPLKTVVKGAVRPKSAFLGQYDLNYTCEIVYYLRERGSLHALRECVPHNLRDGLRGSYRSLTLAGYVRFLLGELAAAGDESAEWYRLAGATLTKLENADRFRQLLEIMLEFDFAAMQLAGIIPDFSGYDRDGEWSLFSPQAGIYGENVPGRKIRIERETAQWLANPHKKAANVQILLDAARVIGVFYQFHLDCAVEARREVLKLILHNENEKV